MVKVIRANFVDLLIILIIADCEIENQVQDTLHLPRSILSVQKLSIKAQFLMILRMRYSLCGEKWSITIDQIGQQDFGERSV